MISLSSVSVVCFLVESLDDLTNLVVKLFSEVENKNVPLPGISEHPFQEEHLKVRMRVLLVFFSVLNLWTCVYLVCQRVHRIF